MVKIGIIGHRNLQDEHQVEEQIENKIQELLSARKAIEFEAYSSIAYGADTLFVRVAEKHKAKIKLILPFPKAEYKETFVTENSEKTEERLNEFEKLCERYIPEIVNEEIPKNEAERNQNYFDCGKALIDKSEVLIAIWDGFPVDGIGGTAQILEYAYSEKKEVHIILARKSTTDYKKLVTVFQNQRDILAQKLKKEYTWKWRIGIILGVAAALCLVFSVSFKLNTFYNFICAFIEICFFTCALGLAAYVNDRKAKKNMIRLRLEAEFFRALAPCIHSEIQLEMLQKDILNNEKGEEKIVLDDEVERFEKLFCVRISNSDIQINEKKEIIENLINSQIVYHEGDRRIKKYDKCLSVSERLINVLKVIFIAGLSIHLVSAFLVLAKLELLNPALEHWLHLLGVLFSLGSPALYAGVEAWKYFEEWEQFYGESLVMLTFFKMQKEKLDMVEDYSSLRLFAHNLREGMWRENLTWQYTINFKVFQGIA